MRKQPSLVRSLCKSLLALLLALSLPSATLAAKKKPNERRFRPAEAAFTLPDLFDHLQTTVFATDGNLSADRRALQRLYLGKLTHLVLEPEQGTPAEASQLAASALRSVVKQAQATLQDGELRDGYTGAHLEDLLARANRTLKAGIQMTVDR